MVDNDEALIRLNNVRLDIQKKLDALGFPLTAIVAGGAVRDLMFGFEPKDYDVYLIPEKGYKVPYLKIAVALEKVMTKPTHVLTPECNREALLREADIFQRQDASPWYNGPDRFMLKFLDAKDPNGTDIQVLFQFGVHTPQELIEFFDLDINQFAFDGYDLYMGLKVSSENVRKALHEGGPVQLLNVGGVSERLEGFHNRFGCDITEAMKICLRESKCNQPFVGLSNDSDQYGRPEDQLPVPDVEDFMVF